MEKQKINELEKDIWFELKSLFHQMERMTFSDRVKEFGELQKLYTVTRKVATKEPDEILPHLPNSTENLSKIADKDEWLNEVRGNDSFKESNGKLYDKFRTAISGKCFSDIAAERAAEDCAQIAKQYSDSKLSELEKWVEGNEYVYVDDLNSKITSLKQ